MLKVTPTLAVVVPAAGIGKRMKADCPKQYLKIGSKTILEHTVNRIASHPKVDNVIIAIGRDDEYFADTQLSQHPKVTVVIGGKERVDSVLSGLRSINSNKFPWVLVHDAARPCLAINDLDQLINSCFSTGVGGILASPVRDTMKRGKLKGQLIDIQQTEDRENLWHALTPQMFPTLILKSAIEAALDAQAVITDEASAIEFNGGQSQIIESSSENIKITHPDDLAFAEFILQKQLNNLNKTQETICE